MSEAAQKNQDPGLTTVDLTQEELDYLQEREDNIKPLYAHAINTAASLSLGAAIALTIQSFMGEEPSI